MKNKIFFLTVLLSALCASVAVAHPPADMKVNYDAGRQAVHCEIDHVTSDMLDHHIRKIELLKNQEAPVNFYFPKQDPQGLVVDLPLVVAPGDVIVVTAISTSGGTKEATLLIPQQTDGTVAAPAAPAPIQEPVIEKPIPEPEKKPSSRY